MFTAGGTSMNANGMASPFSINGANRNQAGAGPDGTSLVDALQLMVSSMGMAISQSTISANALKLENAYKFAKVDRIFGRIDVLGNIIELTDSELYSNEWFEDAGQAALGIALLFPVSAPFAIGGTIILTAWELWEYNRGQ